MNKMKTKTCNTKMKFQIYRKNNTYIGIRNMINNYKAKVIF